jgi:predicted alpha/beta-hydrolase family hydrolase
MLESPSLFPRWVRQPSRMTGSSETRIQLPNGDTVSALYSRPTRAHYLLLLAHGAGAGMSHPFLEALSRELNSAGVATFRYQFPYMEKHRRIPDPPAVLTATVRAAAGKAKDLAPDLPLLAAGKSMGGRMTSMAASEQPLESVRGLIFFGFPLHPPHRPGTKRADHLARVTVPLLFLQGTQDAFAELSLLRPICTRLGSRATLRTVEGADHSFHVLKASGTSDAAVRGGLVENSIEWIRAIL